MLNEDKIRIMTRMAAFDQVEGKRDLSVNGYFRGDYISFQILKSALYATFGAMLMVLMYILYDLETFLEDFYKMDVMEFADNVMSKYLVALAIYVVISYLVYAYRYTRAKRRIRDYLRCSRMLRSIYEEESR